MAETTADQTVEAAGVAVRRIAISDLREALSKGLGDFREKPSHLLFVSLIYPVVMLVTARVVFGEGLLPLIFPIISGGALLGPFVAIGLYELSRRREQGLEVHWSNAFDVRKSPALGAILRLGLALAILFAVWLVVAQAIYEATMGGFEPASFGAFAERLFNTGAGWALILAGNGVGLLFAIIALAISVVSFPLILDRHVGALAAVAASVRAVARNPVPMAAWGLIVALSLLVGAIPFFFGLAVVMPILGHATWHLYRKVIETG